MNDAEPETGGDERSAPADRCPHRGALADRTRLDVHRHHLSLSRTRLAAPSPSASQSGQTSLVGQTVVEALDASVARRTPVVVVAPRSSAPRWADDLPACHVVSGPLRADTITSLVARTRVEVPRSD